LVGDEIFAPEVGAQEEGHDLPLEGISMALADEGQSAISISLGKSTENHVTHTLTSPEHIWLEQTSGGANAALEIESENQTKTLLRFRSTMPPEAVAIEPWYGARESLERIDEAEKKRAAKLTKRAVDTLKKAGISCIFAVLMGRRRGRANSSKSLSDNPFD
jgi:hypothetical protein